MNIRTSIHAAVRCVALLTAGALTQIPALALQSSARADAPGPAVAPASVVTPPPEYVIGPDDVLAVVFWRDKDLSAEVVVRSDGKITLPLLNEIEAVNLTPEQLRERVTEKARRFVEDPNPTVIVRQINSRKVFITGQVERPGPYPLSGSTTVLHLIAMAGGLKEFSNGKKIFILRTEGGRQQTLRFDYADVLERKNLQQNILLKPGDSVVVP